MTQSATTVPALWRQGEEFARLGHWRSALKAYDAVLEQEPGHAMAPLRASRAALALGQYRDGLGYVMRALARRPGGEEVVLLDRVAVSAPVEEVAQRTAGSIVVVATDAPLSDRNLERLAHRGLLGIARTGSPMTNGSGEYAVAFSTNLDVRRTAERRARPSAIVDLPNDQVSPLFEAAVEAAEEAAINSLFAATPTDGNGRHIDALPLDQVIKLYKRARR